MSNQKKIAELQAQAKKIQDKIEQLKGKDSLSELAKKVEGKCLLLEDRLFLKVHVTKDDGCLFFDGTEVVATNHICPKLREDGTCGYSIEFLNDMMAKGKFTIITDTTKLDKLVHAKMQKYEDQLELAKSVIVNAPNRRYEKLTGNEIKKMDNRSLVTYIRDNFDGLLFQKFNAFKEPYYIKVNVAQFDGCSFAVKTTLIEFSHYGSKESVPPTITESAVYGVRIYPNDTKSIRKMISFIKGELCDKDSKTITWNDLIERVKVVEQNYFGGARQIFLQEKGRIKDKLKWQM